MTLAHIMGFLKPDSGRVIVAHQDITDMTEAELRHIRRKVTMVFQNGALFDSITVGENILFSLELREDYSPENKEEVVNGLLAMVDLLDVRFVPYRLVDRTSPSRRDRSSSRRAARVHLVR